MRRLLTLLVAAALLLAAGATTALTIDPNPVNQTRGTYPDITLDADVTLVSLSGDTMTFELSVTTGGITRIDVSMLFDALPVPSAFNFVTAAGTNGGPGVDVTPSVPMGGAEAQFVFASTVGYGDTVDQFWVQFANDIQDTWVGTITFDNGLGQDSTYAIIPEPGTLLLMGGALGGLGLLRRRRP